MSKTKLTIYDLEALHDAAEHIISTAQFNFFQFDEDGNYIYMSVEDRHALLEDWINASKNHYLCFRENNELHQINPYDAMEMSLAEIKEKYLKDYLKKLCMILRKDAADLNGVTVSDEVPDSYLEDMIALRWRGNLVLWAMQWKNTSRRE